MSKRQADLEKDKLLIDNEIIKKQVHKRTIMGTWGKD